MTASNVIFNYNKHLENGGTPDTHQEKTVKKPEIVQAKATGFIARIKNIIKPPKNEKK